MKSYETSAHSSFLHPRKGSNVLVPRKLQIADKATGILIPETNERCIVFPFDRKKLKYFRDTYQKQQISLRCSADHVTKVISDIEMACENFKRYRLYKTLISINVILGILVLLGSFAVIVTGVLNRREDDDKNVYTKTGHHKLTVLGIFIFSFTILVMYLCIITVGCLSNDLSAVYIDRYNTVLGQHKKEFEEIHMRWKIGTKRLWLELWLDEYKPPAGKTPNRTNSSIEMTHDNGDRRGSALQVAVHQRLADLRRRSHEEVFKIASRTRPSMRKNLLQNNSAMNPIKESIPSPRSILNPKVDTIQSQQTLDESAERQPYTRKPNYKHSRTEFRL